jgi:hypothetical protein
MNLRKMKFFFLAAALVMGAALASRAAAQSKTTDAGVQKTFKTPEEAAKAYAAASEANDASALQALLGMGNDELINSGDETQDKRRRTRFATLAKESLDVKPDPYSLGNFIVYAGKQEWPLPIPIVKDGEVYRFDATAARTEILARRIGHNELDAIAFLREVAEAQIDFAYADQQMIGIREYAKNIMSDSDKRDGLYWQAKDGDPASPLAPVIEKAEEQGYELPAPGEPFRYHGYVFRMLTSQGSNATGGARDYIVQGKMIGGFAAIGYPAEYGTTGVKTFVVNQDGVVYEKDLAAGTKSAGNTLKSYNPDKTWMEAPQEDMQLGATAPKP